MKRLILLSVALMLGIMLSAQTQQGYVTTKGRLANDGSVIAGTRIPNATIQVKGRTSVISQANGTFSFPIPDKSFYLTNVQKQGYVLTDPEILSKQYTYSANDLIIVMEDLAQQEADRRAIERKISSKLYSQLQQRGEELESLKEQNKITEEKYRELLQKLNQDQDDNEKIIKDMAERYTKMDFDQIDEFNRKVSEYILNGELMKADSMLNSKGNLTERSEQLKRERSANAKERAELDRRQANLQQSEAYAQAKLEEVANDCYNKFEIFKMKHENDSAAYYIELRAGLDTTNVEWMYEAGGFIRNYIADYNKSISYFKSILRHKLLQFGEQDPSVATSLYDLGSIYTLQNEYDKAQEHFFKALNIWNSVIGEDHSNMANCYNNLGYIYTFQSDFPKALEYYNKALSIQKKAHGENHPDVATSYNNLGGVYSNQGNFTKGLEYYEMALDINKNIYEESHPKLAVCYNNIGSIYSHLGEHERSLEYYNKALSIQLTIYGEKHPDVARSYINIGFAKAKLGDRTTAMEYYYKALDICKSIYGEKHEDVAACYNNIASIYSKQGDYESATQCYQKALTILKTILGENDTKTATLYNNIGRLYSKQNEYDKALEYYNKAIEIWKPIIGETHPNIATTYHNIATIFYKQDNFPKAQEYYDKAYFIQKNLYGAEDPRAQEAKELVEEAKARVAESKMK